MAAHDRQLQIHQDQAKGKRILIPPPNRAVQEPLFYSCPASIFFNNIIGFG